MSFNVKNCDFSITSPGETPLFIITDSSPSVQDGAGLPSPIIVKFLFIFGLII